MNFYAILGIPRDADEETIRDAYRLLARRYHPDRGAGSSAEKFRQIKQAYETLIDSRSRQEYNRSLQWTPPIPVRAQPLVRHFEHYPQEDAAVFGRFERPPHFSLHNNFLSCVDRRLVRLSG